MSRSVYGNEVTVISGNHSCDFITFDAVVATEWVAIMMRLLTPSALSFVISAGICWSISGAARLRLTSPGATVYDDLRRELHAVLLELRP